jgi:glyoxylase-like metal-dependent hydrolase (beta-lactamase superfamily II)
MGYQERKTNMIEQILPGLFQVKVPFQGNPLRDINVYIIKDGDKSLMVDNGIDLPETRRELFDDIRKLGLNLEKTEFFITHSHPDHCSNTALLANLNSVIYMGKADIDMLSYGSLEMQEKLALQAAAWGLPEGDLLGGSAFKPVHPMFDFAVKRGWRLNSPVDGDVIKAGDYSFRCIETPGHSDGHICLYEPLKKIILCGDHILQDVTPVILTLSPDDNPLADYFSSLEKVYNLDIRLTLPAHRGVISDMQARIDAIKRHHQARLSEILSILDGKGLNPYRIASRMHWDVSYQSWEAFPIWQRMLATSEAEAHLHYLAWKHAVRKQVEGNLVLYSAA